MSLLAEHGVRVQPGHFYDFGAGAWLVISLLTELSTFEAGLAKILLAVDGP